MASYPSAALSTCLLHGFGFLQFPLPARSASLPSTINFHQRPLRHVHISIRIIVFSISDIHSCRPNLYRNKRFYGLNASQDASSFLSSGYRTSTSNCSSQGIEEFPVSSLNSQAEVQIDLTLPRRRLLVEFTCNSCGARSRRTINPEAYKKGTVFVQCGGCEVYHKLVDNLHLIQEYDFRNDPSADDTNALEPQDQDSGE